MKKEKISDLNNKLLDQAIDLLSGRKIKEGVEKIETLRQSISRLIPMRTVMQNDLLGIIAEELGEERVFAYWREYAEERFDFYKTQSPIQILRSYVIMHNAMESNVHVEEKEDRYIVTLDPCGGAGAARRRNMITPEKNVTKKVYDFLWNKKGVPYFCVHCAFIGEIIPREKVGKAMWTQDWPESPEGVCRCNILK